MKALLSLLAVIIIASPAFAQSATGKVGFELPALPSLNITGELTQPTPVIAPAPQEQIAVPLITQQHKEEQSSSGAGGTESSALQSERQEPAVDLIRNVWNFFFGLLIRI